MSMYKLVKDTISQTIVMVLRSSDNAFIPMDEANTDYQEYLRWIELGNTPEPADNPPTE